MEIAVITKAPTEGNLASIFVLEKDDPYNEGRTCLEEVEIAEAFKSTPLNVRVRVFKPGEIIVIGSDGRDQFTRKPSKWNVEYEVFDNIEDAIARARAVQ